MFGKTYGNGAIFKACVRRGTCKDACKVPSHGWTYEYSLDGKPRQKTFRDDPGKPGSGKTKAEAFAKVLVAGKVTGDTAFADTRGAVNFLDYCARWIERVRGRSRYP